MYDGIYESPKQLIHFDGITSDQIPDKENKFLKDEIERLRKEEFQVESLTNQNDNLKKILESDTNITAENFVVPEDSDYVDFGEETEEWDIAEAKPGLWENIRKKKEREGKNYKPAKPGDKDYPKQDALKKAQGEPKKKKKKKMSSYSSEYEMTDEEFSEVMTLEELELYKN